MPGLHDTSARAPGTREEVGKSHGFASLIRSKAASRRRRASMLPGSFRFQAATVASGTSASWQSCLIVIPSSAHWALILLCVLMMKYLFLCKDIAFNGISLFL
jgi:hypothetical protein